MSSAVESSEPTITLPEAARVASDASCQVPPPSNDSVAAVPVPVMMSPPLLNSAVSNLVGANVAGSSPDVVSFQLSALAKFVSLAPVQISVLGTATTDPVTVMTSSGNAPR